MLITVLETIFSQCDKEASRFFRPFVEYDSTFYKSKQFGKEKIIQKNSMIDGRNGKFLTGFLPKFQEIAKKKKIKLKIINNFPEKIYEINKPHIPNITFRQDQINLIEKALSKKRGILLSATGTGKTILTMGIISCFKNPKVLFLCRDVSIAQQTEEVFEQNGFKDVFLLCGQKDRTLSQQIIISTVQTFSKINPEIYFDLFDIIFIDEADELGTLKSQYAKVLTNTITSYRIGLTATMPTDTQRQLVMEGLLGPVIGEFSINEAIEKKHLAQVKIKLINVPLNTGIAEKITYKDIYKFGIVLNKQRNKLIIKEARKQIKKEKTVLIMVKQIEHANEIIRYAKLLCLDIEFIQGKTEIQARKEIQYKLNSKKIKCVICTTAWKRGVNIPELNCVILAACYKDHVPVMQNIGRGTRKTENKNSCIIIDFLDPYRYLANHTINRLQLYNKNKWL